MQIPSKDSDSTGIETKNSTGKDEKQNEIKGIDIKIDKLSLTYNDPEHETASIGLLIQLQKSNDYKVIIKKEQAVQAISRHRTAKGGRQEARKNHC